MVQSSLLDRVMDLPPLLTDDVDLDVWSRLIAKCGVFESPRLPNGWWEEDGKSGSRQSKKVALILGSSQPTACLPSHHNQHCLEEPGSTSTAAVYIDAAT